jgi:hypothetical protein
MQHVRYDFLIADSFATRAEAELALGNPDAAQRVLERAEAGYATIRRLAPMLDNADERKEIEAKLDELREKLDALGSKVARMMQSR